MYTRRTLVKGSIGFFGMGLFACRSIAKTRPRSANEEVRVAVAGVRSRGNGHVHELWNVPNVRVVAICDVDRNILDQRAREYSEAGRPVERYVDFRRLLDRPDIDAVSIATPNHSHALQAIWACQAGKDVYLEKPVSHNIREGAQVVRAARKYERIVMSGTQCRSSQGIADAIDWIQKGNLGRIQHAHGLCYKPRQSIGKVAGPQPVPEHVDYDLWCGPAPAGPLMRQRLHYDWHWVFETGNGDVGNQGIHQMDIARWALGEDRMPPRVLSVGGRFGYDDDGNTPNTQLVVLDYERAPILFEVRGLPRDKAAQSRSWDPDGMDRYRGARVGVVVQCADGHLLVPNYSSAIAFDADGAEVARWEGATSHFAHFVDLVRSRRQADSRADIREGHVSSAMCHMGNVSHLTGTGAELGQIETAFAGRPVLEDAWSRMRRHLVANEVDLAREQPILGRSLRFDPDSERFDDRDANALLSREYRAPFVVPERV